SGQAFCMCISPDGRYTAFGSLASNLVSGDSNQVPDVFVHDLQSSGFVSLCVPGADGVIDCPCSNPPSAPGRGCENSSATGGANLVATGNAYLSMDSVVFTTSGETPSPLSIVPQGNGEVPGGSVYGQGVRCLGGTVLRRLFTKQATGGSIR